MKQNTFSMPIKGLYAITDNTLIPQEKFLDAIESGLKGGIRLLQYRDKNKNLNHQLQQTAAIKQLCHRYHVPLLINDDVQLAVEVGADGVHLGKQDASLQQARQQLGEKAIIGVSCYQQLERAQLIQQQGASYVAFGRFFPTKTKPEAQQAPIELLQQSQHKIQIPVVAIGGITVDNGKQLLTAGADLLAVIHGLFGQTEQIETKAQHYADLFR